MTAPAEENPTPTPAEAPPAGSTGRETFQERRDARRRERDVAKEQAPVDPMARAFSSEDLAADSAMAKAAAAAPKKAGPSATGRRLRRLIDEDLGDELDAALENFDPDLSLAKLEPTRAQRPGDVQKREAEKRTVKVLAVRGLDVFVDLGGKSEGIIPLLQFEGKTPPNVGDLIEVLVDRFDPNEGVYRVRIPGAAQEADWSSVSVGMIVDAQVKKTNKGGLEVTVNGLRGFMPAGQVALEHIPELGVFVNQTLRCEVTEANVSEKNLVLSRKIILQREREEKARETLASLAEGQTRDGVVKRIQDFGAFVDLGGIDGLVPVSQMSWQRVKHPGDVLQVGQQVRVQILKLDREAKRISLGLKQLVESPWTKAAETYYPGVVVRGVVSKLMDFGAFVELEPAIEGLVHISELAHGHTRRVNDVVQPGQEIEVKVLSFDSEQKRISLSMKQAKPLPEPEPEPEKEAAAAGAEPEVVEPPKPKKPQKPLKGGIGSGGGPLFGPPGGG